MGSSMNDRIKILAIVEGEKAEPAFFKSIEAAYSLDFSIYCLGTNIYTLYKKMKEYDFNADIKKVLAELHPDFSDMLSQKFAYTYLFFDMDPHHSKKEDPRSLEEIAVENIRKIKEMVSYFTNETDPTIGRLYINYPMHESFRNCDIPFDPHYRKEYVFLKDISNFKKYVAQKKMVRKHLDKYTSDDFDQLTKMNIFKLNEIINHQWCALNYDEYLFISTANIIIEYQSQIVANDSKIAVLNSSLFFLLDYFGNKNGFYDRVVSG